jgi:DNA-binding beta-propeller fold protein YncE
MKATHRRGLTMLGLCLALAGCGTSHGGSSGASSAAPPSKAAEPGHAPAVSTPPAGTSVKVGNLPQGIAVDAAGIVAVGVRNPSAIVLLRAATGAVLSRIPIAGAPRHLALAGPDGPLLVPEESQDRLLELTLPGGQARSFAVGDFPHAAAAGFGRVYVGDERGGALSVILPSGTVQRVGGFTQPGGIAVTGDDIAVVDVGAFTLTLLDARTLQVKARIGAGAGPTHDAAGPGGRVYVADTRGNALLTFATDPLRLLGRTRVPGSPYGIAIDPRRGRLWLTETADNRLAELGISGPGLPHITHTFPTGRQPDTVAVEASNGHVFVADQIAGTVEEISPGP